jgi:glycosyltransferase involved in cell wall biosynthesis
MPSEFATNSVIVCHPALLERLVQLKTALASPIKIDALKINELDYLNSSNNTIQRGNRELKIIEAYLLNYSSTSLIFMEMNAHQLALGNWKFPKEKILNIHGILLNPFNPPNRKSLNLNKVNAFFLRLRKKLQLFLMLRNQSIKSVFILNDRDAVDYMNSLSFSRNVFRFLIDPIPAGMRSIQVSKEKSESNRQFSFIMVGAISPRKGCLEVIKALKHANFPNGTKVSLNLMGAFSKEYPAYSKLIKSEIESLKLTRSDVIVLMKNEFIDNETFCQEISHSDCVLAPYINFNGSSGMIGHACRYQKPLIVSDDGLIGDIVERKQLGICVDPSDIDALAITIEKMIRSDFEYSQLNAKTYFENASHFEFARNLIV